MIYRLLAEKLSSSRKSVLLLGPRQTGKSTILKSLRPDLSINLANESEFLRHSVDARLLESLIISGVTRTIFIDEIQRIPSMLNVIQSILDNIPKGSIKFYLSGSSARKLRRGEANLLPGRLFTYSLSGLCAKELHYDVDIEKAMKFGLLPEPYLDSDPSFSQKLLESYSSTYLKEEIKAEALSRNIQGFARWIFSLLADLERSILRFVSSTQTTLLLS